MESGNSRRTNNQSTDYSTDFYSRNTNARSTAKGTVVPGMDQFNGSARQSAQGAPNASARSSSRRPGKPVAGFLYSISRQGIGEYWPLYQGQNTIGSSSNCNICLREGTVSGEHAVLVVRKMKNPEKTIASISDARSTNGTMINGESLGFAAMECFNGDIITIGENYELVLLLVDVKALGLRVAENFIDIDNAIEDGYEDEDPYTPGYTQAEEDNFPPRFEGSRGSYNNSFGTDGTVGMDGSNGIKGGGTVGM